MKRSIYILAAIVTVAAVFIYRARSGGEQMERSPSDSATDSMTPGSNGSTGGALAMSSEKADFVENPPADRAQSTLNQSTGNTVPTAFRLELETRRNARLAASQDAATNADPRQTQLALSAPPDQISKSYEDFFDANNVPADRRRKVAEILANRQIEGADIFRLGRERGLSQKEILSLYSDLTKDTNQQLIAALGADTAAKADAFVAASAVASKTQPVVSDLSARCEKIGAPLSPDAQQAIAKVILVTDPGRQGSFTDAEFAQFKARMKASASMQAKRILTPQQLALFEEMQSERNTSVVVKN